jgi:beta-galactosidase
LIEEDTYDVTRIVISVNDQYGNALPYQMPAVTLETAGPVEIIGPKTFALIGGSRAFWIKSTGEAGDAQISVHVEGFEKENIHIKMEISAS